MALFSFKQRELQEEHEKNLKEFKEKDIKKCCVIGCEQPPIEVTLSSGETDNRLRHFPFTQNSDPLKPIRWEDIKHSRLYICRFHNNGLLAIQDSRNVPKIPVEKTVEVPAKITDVDHVLWLMDKVDIDEFEFSAEWDRELWIRGIYSSHYIYFKGNVIFGIKGYGAIDPSFYFLEVDFMKANKIKAKRNEKIAEKRKAILDKLADEQIAKTAKSKKVKKSRGKR